MEDGHGLYLRVGDGSALLARSEHGIARLGTYDLQRRGYPANGLTKAAERDLEDDQSGFRWLGSGACL
jgi:hypothetical protein